MKGFMQLQTIIYVIFAVIILMVGIFSVESYLTNLKVNANYELDEMDMTVIGKRITSSCYLENNAVEDFYVSDLGYKNELIPFSANCLSGFNKDSYSVKYFDINKNLLFSEGNLECDIPEMSLYLRSNQDIFVEVCYES